MNVRPHRHFLRSAASLAALCVLAPTGWAENKGPVTMNDHIKPLLKQFCSDCHNEQKAKGDFNLDPLLAKTNLAEDHDHWEKIIELLESREMPPEKKPQPTEDERAKMIHFLEAELVKADCTQEQNPGKVTIRRLNKEEYKNTIRDLLGVNYGAEDFPNDEVGYGYDNIGDVLSLSPMLLEKFLGAADDIAHKAIVVDAQMKPFTTRLKGETFKSSNPAIQPVGGKMLGLLSSGEAAVTFKAPAKGDYTFRVRAAADQAGNEPAKLDVRIGGKENRTFDVTAKLDKPGTYEVKLPLEAGAVKVAVAFLNDFYDPENPDPKARDRNLFVEAIDIVGPPQPPSTLPESHKRLITRMPEPGQEKEVATEILGKLARRAYRRPVEAGEVAKLVAFVELAMKNGGSFLEGIQAGVQATLCSPHFLFRWELDPKALNGGIRPLNDYEIASRLSYFLWSSLPDQELFDMADKGLLLKDGNLEKQVQRMMKDWKARAFVTNFAGQWLQIRNIWEVGIDPDIFKKWDDSLKGMMKEETERFFEAIMKEDRPVTDLIDADFTFLNEKLAKWYGIEGVKGNNFQRVTLPADSPRGGVLTQGSVLVSTSNPTRTSPVIRGKWILEQILGTPPPPPPPDVPPLQEQKQVNQTTSLRQRLEQHRSQADCAGCHAKMDPLGFALENFDASGAWRDMDGKFPIDASGKLVNGTSFNGPKELKKILKGNKNFVKSLTRNMMTYALGRGLEFYDKCAADAVMAKMEKQENRFSALVIGIVTSDPFLKRKSELANN